MILYRAWAGTASNPNLKKRHDVCIMEEGRDEDVSSLEKLT